MQPRDYQVSAIDSVFWYFQSGKTGNPLVAMPTGTGKSVVIGGLIQRIFQLFPNQRVMMLTHVKELIEQNFDKLKQMWPSAPAGINSSGLRKREIHFPITYAGIASVKGMAEEYGHIDLIFIDEAHLVAPKEDSMYQAFIGELKKINPALKVVGFTATPFRQGQGMLTDEGGLFTDICFDGTGRTAFNWFIDQGYLTMLVPMSTDEQLDVSKVSTRLGEYDQKELQKTVDKEDITRRVVAEAIARAAGRHHWLCFASGVQHTINVAEEFERQGISATYVHSNTKEHKMSDAERDRRIADYKAGKYQVMVNNGILTTGFDFPALDCIIMLRPTKSVGLWVQMLGRGTRPYYITGFDLDTVEGRLEAIRISQKPNCLVLDFAGNTAKLGPINDPMIPKKKGDKPGEAPVRICTECGCYNHASATVCFNCGHEFPRAVMIAPQASRKALIARDEPTEAQVVNMKIDRVLYAMHMPKSGRAPCIKVTYYCGLHMFQEWVTLEHTGFAGKRARDWWRERYGDEPPETVKEAMEMVDALRIPSHLNVWINKKPPEIMGFEYNPV